MDFFLKQTYVSMGTTPVMRGEITALAIRTSPNTAAARATLALARS